MPTYQYRCTQCGNELEVVQKFTDPALTECAECHGSLRKIYNAVGVVFKGSGFYRTDSRSADGKAKGSTSTEKTGAAASSTSGSASEASTSGSGTNGSSKGSTGTNGSSNGSTKKPAPASSTAA